MNRERLRNAVAAKLPAVLGVMGETAYRTSPATRCPFCEDGDELIVSRLTGLLVHYDNGKHRECSLEPLAAQRAALLGDTP